MRKKEFIHRSFMYVPVFLVLMISVFSVLAFSVADKAVIRLADKADVQIIENKAKPSGSQRLILTKEITIGKLEQGGSAFGAVAGADVAADGRIFVLDFKAKKVNVFDPNGKKLKEFGQEGQGPGEWNTPSGLQLLSDRELMINDSSNRKLIYSDLEGKMTREVSYAKKLAMLEVIDSGGQYVGCEMGMEGNSIAYTIAKYDADFNQLFKIDTLLMASPLGGGKINPFTITYDYCLDGSGNIIYGRSSSYEIKYFNPEGQLVKIVRKEYRPQSISQKDKEEMLKQIPETPGMNLKEMVVFPANYPAFSGFFVDEENRLYVRTYEKGKAKDSYLVDIFSAEGKLIARCEMTDGAFLAKNGKIYTIEKDEEGYQYICRYQATWKK